MSEEVAETPDSGEKEPVSAEELVSQASKKVDKKQVTVGTIISLASLIMFIGGALVTLMLLARSFNLQGQDLVSFVIASCAVVFAMAGYLITNLLGDKPLIGAFIGMLLGGLSGLLLYTQTQHLSWWQ